jgi:hypothetical protein
VKVDKSKIYLIEWQDAHANASWLSDKEVREFIDEEKCICQEVGWILSETKDEIVLAARTLKYRISDTDEWGMIQKIPKAWIRKKMIFTIKAR